MSKCRKCGEEHPELDWWRNYQRGITTIIDETWLYLAAQQEAQCNRLEKAKKKHAAS